MTTLELVEEKIKVIEVLMQNVNPNNSEMVKYYKGQLEAYDFVRSCLLCDKKYGIISYPVNK